MNIIPLVIYVTNTSFYSHQNTEGKKEKEPAWKVMLTENLRNTSDNGIFNEQVQKIFWEQNTKVLRAVWQSLDIFSLSSVSEIILHS